jgi:predicted ATPase/transcriptional regulator with XRE-family HTH domain
VLPDSFGPALRFLRKRARLTQDELGRAVGYSREQIARLENGSRLPDLAVIAALFVPALMPEQDRRLIEQFLGLAGQTRRDQRVTITRTKETRVRLVQETISAPPRPQHTPPAPLLPLLGRQAEVDELLECLQSNRLITIVGAPGIGKTRLALEVANAAWAQAAFGQFADGVAFVSLAEVSRADDILTAVLQALGLSPTPPQTPAEAILAYLAPRRLLVVMDNCEHIVESTLIFGEWLAAAPHLKLLCTSRLPLDLYGEQEWPLSPLAVPDLAEPAQLELWRHYPSLQLLLARARAVDPGFTLTEDNLLPLASLCVALDGLPLALELAAVRLRDLSPGELVQQLLALRGHAQLSSTWLQQTRRNVAERHRTLQAAINWSVQLLPIPARDAFGRLGVFAGGGSTDAALAVAQADPAILDHLAHANLIRLEKDRVLLLETLRAFSLEQLTTTGQLRDCREAHARYYAGFAKEVFDGMRGEDQGLWMARAQANHGNCLAALRWALAEENGDIAIAIAGDLWWFWYRRGLFALARELLEAALQLPSSDPAARARALNGAASFCLVFDEYDANLAYHQEGLALRRQLADSEGIATTLHNMGLTALSMGDYDQAMTWLEESIAVYPEDQTSALAHLGLIAQETLNLDQARQWLELAYEGAMAATDRWMQAFVMNYLADVLRESGELGEAYRLAQVSLNLFAELEDSYYLPDAQLTLAQIALAEDNFTTATALVNLAREQYEARDDPVFVATVLLVAAELALKRGVPEEAAGLWEQARSVRQSVKRAVSPREQASFDKLAAVLSA